MFSEELKQILKQGILYSPEAKVSITTATETVVFTGDDLLSGIEIEESALSPAGAPIGGLAIAELKVKLKSFGENIHELLNPDDIEKIYFDLKFEEEYYYSDVYNIDKLEVSEDRLEITITAYEPAHNLNVDYVEPLETYPALAQDWVDAFAAQYSLNIDVSELPFINDVINQPNVDKMSAKQVFSKFLEWNLAAASFSNNTLVCKPLVNVHDVVASESFDRDSVSEYKTKQNDLGVHGVNILTLALSEDVESENFFTEDEDMLALEGKPIELRLSGNPFFSTPEERVEYTPRMFEIIKGFNYHAYEMESRAMYLEPLDVIEQEDLDSLRPGAFNIPVYTYKMVFDGGFKVVVGAPAMDNAETTYKWNQLSPSKRTEVRVNKIDGRITLVAEELTVIDNEVARQGAEITIEKEKISSLVSETGDMKQEYRDEFGVIGDKYTDLEQRADRVELTVAHSNGLNLLQNSVMYNDSNFWDHEDGLRGETNAWSLTKTSKHCITGEGMNEQTINVVSGNSYAISFDYIKQTAAGLVRVYYILNNERVDILEQTDAADGTMSIFLENITGGNLTVGIEMGSISTTQPAYIANLMVAKGEVYEWSPAIGEIYTINVLIDEAGVKVKNIDGNAYTAMTPYEFAHYYDNEKVFSFDRQVAQVQDLLVKGKTFEMDGGIKWINDKTINKTILVNMRGGN